MQRLIEVSVEKLSLGGSGIARHEGLVIFIPFSAPGDRLLIKITSQKKSFAEAEIVEILNPSKQRRTPPCPVYGRCGGCNWQHIQYSQQLHEKQTIVEELFLKFLHKNIPILPIIPSPQEWNYRNRIQIKHQNGKVGFYAKKSHTLVEIQNCLIAEPTINEKLMLAAQSPLSNQRLDSAADDTDNNFAFSQVNTLQNANLVSTVLQWSENLVFDEIYDLYSGGGNFSFPLLEKNPKSKIIAVELEQESVARAQKIISDKNLSPKRIQYILGDVEFFLKRCLFAKGSLVLLDPPRGGCSEGVMRNLAKQPFQKLLYISCNPSTLVRDLQRLNEYSDNRMRITRVQPFDMFPQTDHVEVLVELFIDRSE